MKSTGNRWLFSDPRPKQNLHQYLTLEFDSLTRYLQELEQRLTPSGDTTVTDSLASELADLTGQVSILTGRVDAIESSLASLIITVAALVAGDEVLAGLLFNEIENSQYIPLII